MTDGNDPLYRSVVDTFPAGETIENDVTSVNLTAKKPK